MKMSLTVGLTVLAVVAIASCDLPGVDARVLQLLVRPNPGDEPE